MSPLPETSPEPARLSHAGPGLATECTREVFEVSFDIFSALPKPRVIQGIEADTKNGVEPSGLPAWSRARQRRQKLRTGGLHKLKEVGAGVRPPKVTFLSEKKIQESVLDIILVPFCVCINKRHTLIFGAVVWGWTG